MWPETQKAKADNRHELVLSGTDVARRIEEDGFDEDIYSLVSLNFLEVSRTTLKLLGSEIGQLVKMQNLVLRNNTLESLPESLGSMQKLKFLDVSGNQLKTLPRCISDLTELYTLNASMNKLDDVPPLTSLVKLTVLDISHNNLEKFPEGLNEDGALQIAELNLSNNCIVEIPADVSTLMAMKLFNMSDNKINVIPGELSIPTKLRELKFGNNKIKDKRLIKLESQCSTKSVLDYLRQQLEKNSKGGGGKGKGGKKITAKKAKAAANADTTEDTLCNMMAVVNVNAGGDDAEHRLVIKVGERVVAVRPYLVCCVVNDLDFGQSSNLFKRFIGLQTKLHDSICQKRMASTIATHDMSKVKAPLLYDAQPPQLIKVVPLFQNKPITAAKLMQKLQKEAEDYRKEKKRNTISGVHKYIDLLAGKQLYPCLMDSEDRVISLPPITNSWDTQISPDTTSILIEVTSSQTLDICKKTMDTLLAEMLEMGIGSRKSDDLQVDQNILKLEQVCILDASGSMKVVYPSQTDLQIITPSKYRVIRN